MKTSLAFLFLCFSLVCTPFLRAQEVLPDLVPIADQAEEYLYGWTIDTTSNPGRTLLRLNSTIGNRGAGPLEIWGGDVDEDSLSQAVHQRIYNLNGTVRDRLAGHFEYHSAHGHIHFEGFATYNLRRVTTGNGVGTIIASGGKTSFCILNLTEYWPNLYAAAPIRNGRGGDGCGTLQGLSVGYADIYHASLPGQFIDASGVPSGTYWLEIIADPDNHLLESDETNNATRILINFTNPRPLLPNRSPVITSPGNRSTPRGSDVNLSVSAFDADNNPLTYSATGLPDGLSIDATTGFISGTVSLTAAPSYNASVIVSDGLLSTSASFTWATTIPLTGTGLRGDYFNGTNFQTPVLSRTDATVNFTWAGSPATGVNADAFSVRWSGKVVPGYSQTYTFSVTSDDGVRLSVNGQQIINRWTTGSATATGTIALTANQEVPIVLEYFDSTGAASVKLSWQSASLPKQIIPKNRLFPAIANVAPEVFPPAAQVGVVGENASLHINAADANGDALSYTATGLPAGLSMNATTGLISGTYSTAGTFSATITASDSRLSTSVTLPWTVTPAANGSGLHANYFNGRDLETPVFDRIDATVNQNWGAGSPDPRIAADNFSVRWSGEILPQFNETYTFKVISDNGARLWVNSDLIIYQWDPITGQPPAGTFSTALQLRAGVRVSIRLEYFEATGNASVALLWSSPSQPEQIIPMSRLFPVVDQFTDNFDDNTRDAAKWKTGTLLGQFVSPAGQDLAVPVSETGGRVVITPRANQGGDHYNGYISALPWNLDNLFLSVEVTQTATNGADTIFAICKDPANFLMMVVEDGVLYLDHCAQYVRDITAIPYSPTLHRFWRIRHGSEEHGDEHDEQICFETSPNGITWTIQRADHPRFIVSAVYPELTGGTGASIANPGTASFDNFRFGRLTTLPHVENQPPVPVAGGPYTALRGVPIAFNASASGDPDGTIASYAWNFGDATSGTGPTPSHAYAAAGNYTATLTVTDNEGASASATAAVTITAPAVNLPPTANTGGPYSATTGQAFTLDATRSTDPDGTIATYAWTLGNGATATGSRPTVTYAAAGTFTIALTVTDNSGATATASSTVTVTAPVASLLSDDFNDAIRDATKWTPGSLIGQYLGAAGYDPTLPVAETAAGRLQITPRTGIAGDHYAGYLTAAAFNFTGLAAAVEVPQASTNSADTILAVAKDSQNFAFIVVEDGVLYFDRCTAGNRTVSGIPYSATTHRWWRIRHDATTNRLHFETSANRTTWTSHRNDAITFPITALRIELSAGTFDTIATTVPAQFDNFTLARP